MKPGWQHVKEAITTDQRNLTADEHIHEEEKRELKLNEGDESVIPPKKRGKSSPREKK